MIEKIPLSLIVYDTMVVSPATILMLSHDETLILIRTHRILTHSIAENLCIVSNIRICEVVVAVVFEGKRTFSLTTWQTFETVYAVHLKLVIAKLHLLFWCIVGKFLHVWLELSATTCTPEDVGIAVRCLKHAWVNTIDARNACRFWLVRAVRVVGNSHTYTKSTTSAVRTFLWLWSIWEIEIILTILLNTIWSPHRVSLWISPRYLLLRQDDTVVSPVCEIIRREHMIVRHAEPFSLWLNRTYDVVRWEEIQFPIEDTCGWVSGILIANDRILGLCALHSYERK